MSNRIEIRGMIVGPEYDADWAERYIARGIITPESRVRKQITDSQGDIELYINSVGGSVFDGEEMLNTLKLAKASGRNVSVTVGAMAASQAARIAIGLGEPVKAFRNSKLMFHGAWTVTMGGRQAHEDEAGLLAKINEDHASMLVDRFGVPRETVDEWNAEGRAGWLTAQEAKAYGIVGEILDEEDAIPKLSKEDAAAIAAQGLDIAACHFDTAEPSSEPPAQAMVPAADFEKAVTDLEALKGRLAGLQSAKDKEIADLKTAHAAAVTDLKSQLTALSADLDSAKSELSVKTEELATATDALAETGKQLAAKTDALAKLTGETLSAPETFASWKEAEQKLGYSAARKQCPELYNAFMANR